MKIVSKQECLDWLAPRFPGGFSRKLLEEQYPCSVCYAFPVDTGRKTCTARRIIGCVDTAKPGLFWITTWGVWPSSEYMPLFDGYRKSLGETRHVFDSPGHIFEAADLTSLECLLDLALYFYWDTTLIEGAGSMVLRTSHDEFFDIYAKDEARLQQVKDDLASLKLREA